MCKYHFALVILFFQFSSFYFLHLFSHNSQIRSKAKRGGGERRDLVEFGRAEGKREAKLVMAMATWILELKGMRRRRGRRSGGHHGRPWWRGGG